MLEEALRRRRLGNLLDALEAAIAEANRIDADVGVENLAGARVNL